MREKIGSRVGTFYHSCHALSKDGIIFKIGRDCDEKKDLQKSLRWLLKQEPDQCQILLYTGHILENAYRFIQDQKEERKSPWNWL